MTDNFEHIGYEAPDVHSVMEGPKTAQAAGSFYDTKPRSGLSLWFINAGDRLSAWIFPQRPMAQFTKANKPPKSSKVQYINNQIPPDTECFGLPEPE